VEEGLQKKEIRKDTSAESLGSHYKIERRIYTEKRESIFIVKRRERGSTCICRRLAKKRVYLTL